MPVEGHRMNLNKQETRLVSDPTIRLIPLTQEQFAIVDAADFRRLNRWKWHARRAGTKYYVLRVDTSKKRTIVIFMHRLLLGLKEGDRRCGDHINGNPLDNRRFNLRIATTMENTRNRKIGRNNTTGYKGIRQTPNGTWSARVRAGDVKKFRSGFPNKKAAHAAYCEMAKELHGEFARFR